MKVIKYEKNNHGISYKIKKLFKNTSEDEIVK